MPPTFAYKGKPWAFVLRDAAQFSNSIHDVEKSFIETARTMKINLGIGSYPDKTFRGVHYAHNFVEFFDDKNFTMYDDVAHP